MKKLALKLVLVFAVPMLLTASIDMAYPQQQGGDRHSGGYSGHINRNNGIQCINISTAGVPGAAGGRGDSGDIGITGDAGGVNLSNQLPFTATSNDR